MQQTHHQGRKPCCLAAAAAARCPPHFVRCLTANNEDDRRCTVPCAQRSITRRKKETLIVSREARRFEYLAPKNCANQRTRMTYDSRFRQKHVHTDACDVIQSRQAKFSDVILFQPFDRNFSPSLLASTSSRHGRKQELETSPFYDRQGKRRLPSNNPLLHCTRQN